MNSPCVQTIAIPKYIHNALIKEIDFNLQPLAYYCKVHPDNLIVQGGYAK